MRRSLYILICLCILGGAGCSRASRDLIVEPASHALPGSTPLATNVLPAEPTAIPTPIPIPATPIDSGKHALRNGDWENALAEFQNAQTNSSDPNIQAEALLNICRTYLQANRMEQAIQSLESYVSLYPDSADLPEAYFFLGQAYSALEQYPDASQAYTEYLNRKPGIIDSYVMDMRGDARFAGGDFTGAASDYQSAAVNPGLQDVTFLRMKQARALAQGGDSSAALTLYDEIYAETTNDYTKALIDLRKGQIYTTLGMIDQAYAAYLDAVNNYPASYDTYSALVALVEAGIPVDDLNRGLVDYYAGEYGAALAAFNRYLQNNPADPGTARYFSGLANRALGGFEQAINDWDKLIAGLPDHPRWVDAWEQKAYTLWFYQDKYPDAVATLLDFAQGSPSHPRAGEFLFDAAQVSERAGDLAQAADIWERVMNLYPGDEQALRALFLSGITHYRQGDYAGAFLVFQRYLGSAIDLGDKAMAYFWIGKTQQKLGDPSAARSTWLQAADIDPTGYYSERARDILSEFPPFTPPQAYDLGFDLQAERMRADEWVRSTFVLPENVDLYGPGDLVNDTRWMKGSELWALGLYDLARAEFDDLRQAVSSDPVQSYRLANYLAEIGLYRSATLAARQVLNLAGMSDAETLNAPAYFNHLRFGTYYSDLIIPAAQKYNFHPLFIFSVVRQESLFESFVRSSAAAQGLMQIMPATGAEIAQKLDWPENYTESDLSRPNVNINFGVSYLDAQLELFDGDLYAALAAYNGGPGNAAQWLELAQGDPDLFLEVIRYPETRDYIRRIYEIYNLYRRLYDRSP